MEVSLGIETTHVAGPRASDGAYVDPAVRRDVAERKVRKGADLDVADLARGQRAAFAVDDGGAEIRQGLACGTQAPQLAGAAGDPAGLARAVALRQPDAEARLEALPFVRQERRRARDHETEMRELRTLGTGLALQQHIDDGRIAGGNRRPQSRDVGKKSRAREFPAEEQRGTPAERRERAQDLRGGPIERAVIVEPVLRSDAECARRGGGVGQEL